MIGISEFGIAAVDVDWSDFAGRRDYREVAPGLQPSRSRERGSP